MGSRSLSTLFSWYAVQGSGRLLYSVLPITSLTWYSSRQPCVMLCPVSVRLACDDFHPFSWTKGWEKCIERHVLRAVRPTAPQVSWLKSMASDAFSQGGRLQDSGRSGPDVLQHIIRILCRHLSTATPAAGLQALKNLGVPAGTPFSTYLSELRLLLGNVRCVGTVGKMAPFK